MPIRFSFSLLKMVFASFLQIETIPKIPMKVSFAFSQYPYVFSPSAWFCPFSFFCQFTLLYFWSWHIHHLKPFIVSNQNDFHFLLHFVSAVRAKYCRWLYAVPAICAESWLVRHCKPWFSSSSKSKKIDRASDNRNYYDYEKNKRYIIDWICSCIASILEKLN